MKLLLPSVCALAVLTGCATPKVKPSRHLTEQRLQAESYATLYLGADGRVVTKRTQAGKVQSAGYWNGDGVTGAPSIRIDLGSQEAYFYKGGKLVGMSPISSGREGYNTPTGSFRIIQKNADHVSNLYGNYVDGSGAIVMRNVGVNRDPRPAGARFEGAPMPYFMRITGAVGMHAGYLPGVPDSHGCIRMPREMAETFFANASVGTPVSVVH